MERTRITQLGVSAVVVAAALVAMLCYQIQEYERGVVTRFGKPVRVISESGPHVKAPWPFERLERFDMRLRVHDLRLSESLTKDKRNVIVPVTVVWRVEDPLLFLESLGSEEAALPTLDNIITSGKSTVLARRDFTELVSTDPEKLDLQGIERDILELAGGRLREQFGIRVESVGIQRVSLPAANTPAVLDRMRAERAQFASHYRAEGQRRAAEIRAQTEAESSAELAAARRYAQETVGRARAEAAAIHRDARRADPALHSFLQDMETLKQIVDGQTTLILDGSMPPFQPLWTEPVR